MRLNEERRLLGIDSACKQRGNRLECQLCRRAALVHRVAKLVRIVGDGSFEAGVEADVLLGDAVVVDDREEALGHVAVTLQLHPVLHGAQVVAEVNEA